MGPPSPQLLPLQARWAGPGRLGQGVEVVVADVGHRRQALALGRAGWVQGVNPPTAPPEMLP